MFDWAKIQLKFIQCENYTTECLYTLHTYDVDAWLRYKARGNSTKLTNLNIPFNQSNPIQSNTDRAMESTLCKSYILLLFDC